MNIFVTGGTGLIGRALIKFLANHHTITVLSRNKNKVHCTLGHHINAVSTMNEVDFNAIDIVINLAGEPIADKRWSKKQKHLIEQSRWQITEQIVNGIKSAANPPHTFISGSAIGFYGRQTSPVDENHLQCFDEFSHHLCKQWEDIANMAQSEATRVCILRTGIVLSKQGGALSKMVPAVKMCLGGPIGDGNQSMSWIHIDDMVGIILYLIEQSSLRGVFNATAPNPVSNNEFSQHLANTLNRPNRMRMPKKVVELLFGEMGDLLVYGQAVLPKKLYDAGFHFHYPHLSDALVQLYRD